MESEWGDLKEEKKVREDQDYVPFGKFRDIGNAVCKIERREEVGSGFYTSIEVSGHRHNVICTNNHVVPSCDVAESAAAVFDFDQRGSGVPIKLRPDRIFITNKDLDFSFIGVDQVKLVNYQPIPLEAGVDVEPGDQLRIIQHPDGRGKAFCDGKITDKKIRPPFIRYDVNTEGGSSGSPVLKGCKLIALHCGSVEHKQTKAIVNRGTLVTAILKHLKTEKAPPPNTSIKSGDEENMCKESGAAARCERSEDPGSDELPDVLLMEIGKRVNTRFRQLAVYLGLPNYEVENIAGDPSYQKPSDKALQMLQRWKESDEIGATRSKLVDALKKMGRQDIVRKYLMA